MSTTTEITHISAGVAWLRVAGLALVAWFAFLPLAMLLEPTWDAMIVGPPEQTLASLAGSDTRIMELGGTYLVVRGTEAGFVRRLYTHGAWLVLPARAAGCIDLSNSGLKPRS